MLCGELSRRLQKAALQDRDASHALLLQKVQTELDLCSSSSNTVTPIQKLDLQKRVEALQNMRKESSDGLPDRFIDCIVFQSGNSWKAAIDPAATVF